MIAGLIATTLELAGLTSLILLLVATPLAWWLARSRHWSAELVGGIALLPLVLPPTVLGFYLLIALGPDGPLAPVLALFGLRTLAFTFAGLIVGSVIYSLPFALQPIRARFEAIGDRPLEAAASLRATPLDAFFSVVLPLARPALVSAALVTFAHTVGEFGVVLMIGGSIPGHTQVLSTAIFEAVEAGDYDTAHKLAAGMLVFSLLVILGLRALDRRLVRASA